MQGDCGMFRVKSRTEHPNLPEVLALIQKKESRGFELLYAQYYRFLFSTAYAVLNNESDAKDVVQNVALRLYIMDQKLFPADHEMKWLHTVVKNEALMYARKKKNEYAVDEFPEIPVTDQQIEEVVDIEEFRSLLSTLNSKQQSVVTLKVLGGLSHKEIAELLSLPIGTVQWLYNTSIKKLRRTLTVLTCMVLASFSGLVYQLVQYFKTPDGQPGGDFGISSVPIEEPSFSPWMIVCLILLVVSVGTWILFFKFSDRIPTKKKSDCI